MEAAHWVTIRALVLIRQGKRLVGGPPQMCLKSVSHKYGRTRQPHSRVAVGRPVLMTGWLQTHFWRHWLTDWHLLNKSVTFQSLNPRVHSHTRLYLLLPTSCVCGPWPPNRQWWSRLLRNWSVHNCEHSIRDIHTMLEWCFSGWVQQILISLDCPVILLSVRTFIVERDRAHLWEISKVIYCKYD